MSPDKTTVVLFTDSFPFRCYTEEVFVMPEIEALSKQFDQVIVVPHRITGEIIPMGFENVTVDTSMATATGTKYRVARLPWLLHPWVASQLPNVLKETHNPVRVLSAALYLMNIRRSYSLIKQLIARYSLQPENTLFYTFWFDHVTDSLDFLPEFKAVTRAHGHDIFDGWIKHRMHFIRRRSLAHLCGIFCASNDGAKYMSGSYPEFESKIGTRRLGSLSPLTFSPLPAENSNTITLLSCSRVSPEKRVDLCLATAIAIASAFPYRTIRWIHVGDGSRMSSLKKLMAKTDTLPSNLKIVLKGALPNEQVHKLYQTTAVDWFMLLSSTEGLPVAITEAISYGVPVIATDVGGNSEIVTPETGLLIPAQFNPAMIAGELQPYISDQSAYLELRKSAAKFWKDNFDAKSLREAISLELSKLVKNQ